MSDYTDENIVLSEDLDASGLQAAGTETADMTSEGGEETMPAAESATVSEENVPADGTDDEAEAGADGEADAAGESETGEDSEKEPSVKREKKPYFERAYLLYGNEPSESPVDAKGTLDFLQGLGLDGGELRQAREGKDYAKKMAGAAEDSDMLCSYCGKAISGADYERLRDGRLRCTSCSRTLVKSRDEMLEIYKRVIYHLDALFGASINVPVHVEMLDERKLKKKLKRPLSEVDDKSVLILGVAVRTKADEYYLYVENGAPRLSVIATFIHELTHIWQYTHWKEKELPKRSKKAKLIIYEGMAKWVEIQYLYLIGETEAAKREEAFTRARKDEYGIGFILYDDAYPLSKQTMVVGESPFVTDHYPI